MSVSDWKVRTPGLPTSAAAELGVPFRRTRLLRLTFAVALLALLAASVALARSLESLPTTYFATGSGGVIVLDLSTSVDVQKAQRAQRVLRSVVETDGRIGLVVFSDSAYEMLPPDTRSVELEPLLPFFQTGPQFSPDDVRRTRGGRVVPNTPSARPRESPWSLTFRGGTRISTGLVEARRIIEREGDQESLRALDQRSRQLGLRHVGSHRGARPVRAGRHRPEGDSALPGARGPRALRAARRQRKPRRATRASSQHRRAGTADA